MDKLIDWLFQQTPDGATYLQVIIITSLLFIVIRLFYKDVCRTIREIKNDDEM